MSSAASYRFAFALLIATFYVVTWCHSRPGNERIVHRSFYYWRGTFQLTDVELAALGDLGISRLYIRLFDVAIDERSKAPRPVGVTSIGMAAPLGVEIVPTVFITNDVIRTIDSTGTEALARNIVGKVRTMLPAFNNSSITELQLDCDWTASTRSRYFRLLRAVRMVLHAEKVNWSISATIRLHQLRDLQTMGVPPVDRGMLMVYNTGNPADLSQTNAIFDSDVVRGYLRSLGGYELPLDVALPLFSWGVVFHEGAFLVLLNNLRRSDLNRPEVVHLEGPWYRLATDLYINGQHLFAGDRIRIEEVSQADRIAIASLISSQLPGDSLSVALYHLDPAILTNHDRSDLSALYSALH